ncbi:MAG TPA: hypothetical protein VD964_06335 [Azospirillum sp.]|nr:hypothetical protein [Azospirillum sp.]
MAQSVLTIAVTAALVASAPVQTDVRVDACQCGSASMSGNHSIIRQSGPPGVCTVAQDRGFCAVSQAQRPTPNAGAGRAMDGRAVAALQRIGISLSPDAATEFVTTIPPEQWTVEQTPDLLVALLSSVLWQQPDALAAIHVALHKEAAQLHQAIVTPGAPVSLNIDPFQASVGYGHLELSRGTFRASLWLPLPPAQEPARNGR